MPARLENPFRTYDPDFEAGCPFQSISSFEIENGTYTIHEESHLAPVKEYLKIQGHFSHLTDQDTEKIQEMVDDEWERLLRKARC